MNRITTTRTIRAPLNLVYDAISAPCIFQKIIPCISAIQFLSDQKQGRGTRFRESRIINGRTRTRTCLVLGQYRNHFVRFFFIEAGLVCCSRYSTFRAAENVIINVELHMGVAARVYPFFPKPLARFFANVAKRRVVRSLEGDLDHVKSFCEATESGDKC